MIVTRKTKITQQVQQKIAEKPYLFPNLWCISSFFYFIILIFIVSAESTIISTWAENNKGGKGATSSLPLSRQIYPIL